MKTQISKLTKLLIITLLVLSITSVSGHNVNEIEEIELDVTPVLKQAISAPVQVNIEKDNTIVQLGSINHFTIRHGIFGSINFISHNVNYDGFEAYRIVLHQDIYLEYSLDFVFITHSRELTDNALRETPLYFTNAIGALKDVEGFFSDYYEPINDLIDGTSDQLQYTIESYIEIIRGTKQNATLNFEYDISSYEIPNIPSEEFHKKITLITKLFPQNVEMIESSTNWYDQNMYLFLPLKLVPINFQNPEGHELNLTSIPINIYLKLKYQNEDHNKQTKVSDGNVNGVDQAITDTGQIKNYRLPTEVKESQLFQITISTLKYQGEVDGEVYVSIPAIFTDSSLYASNEYPFSPNQYILIISFIGSVFIYKLVDYVDYRKFQEILAYKNYELLEKEFNG